MWRIEVLNDAGNYAVTATGPVDMSLPVPPADRSVLAGMDDETRAVLAGLSLDWSLSLPGIPGDGRPWSERWRDGALVESGWFELAQADARVVIPFAPYTRYRAGQISRWDALAFGDIIDGSVDDLLALSGMLDLTYELMIPDAETQQVLAEIAKLGQTGL